MKDFGRRALFSFRAPVVSITPHKKDFCGGFEHLENLMECFSYDTSHDFDLIHTNPAVLPDNYLATTITECAYMQIRDNEKLGIFPAQYRDTAVLLHSSFFKNKDIIEFVKRNVWATILIFGGSVPKEKFLCLAVDLNLMNLSTRNWDTEESEQLKNRVSNLISLFAIWLHGISCSADFYLSASRWIDMGNLAVRKYNLAVSTTNLPILQGSQTHYYGIQMATLRAFLDFCQNMHAIDQETADSTWDAWANEILPGSRNAEIFNKKECERIRQTAEDNDRWRKQCERLFKGFLENATDDMIANRTEVAWKSFNINKYYRDRLCVFVDNHEGRSTGEGIFPAVKITRDDLERYSTEHGGQFDETIKKLWNMNDLKSLPYVYSCKTVSFYTGVNFTACVLRLENLTFLNSGCLEKLRAELGPEKKAKKSR